MSDMKKYLFVKESSIHGKGLFTTVNIPLGKVLGYCEVVKVDKHSDYSLLVNDEDLYDVVCKFRYINHSDEPNVIIFGDLSVVACDTIRKGSELTHDYQ